MHWEGRAGADGFPHDGVLQICGGLVSDFLFDLAVPRTDAAVFVQGILALVVFGVALWRVRRNPDLRTFVVGLATLTFALFAVRALH